MSNGQHDDEELDEIWTQFINGIQDSCDGASSTLHDRVHPVAERWYEIELLSGMAWPYPQPDTLAQFCFCLGGMVAADVRETHEENGQRINIVTLIAAAMMIGVEVGQAFENGNGLLKDLWEK